MLVRHSSADTDNLPNSILDPLSLGAGVLDRSSSKSAFYTRDLATTLGLCLTGSVSAILPEPICRPYLDSGQLIEILTENPLPVLQNFLVYEQRKLMRKEVSALVDFLIK